jgi:hydrogenase maturation factor HypF (carbamoyltransferase family)
MQQQKQRGKDIFKRESGFATEREQQRRSREEAARKAREEAAERSRQLSREWAQKQKAKKVASAGGVGAGGVPSFAA